MIDYEKMSLNSHEFALMLDDLKPMPIIKQIMIYNKRSESKIIPEYLEMVININHDICWGYRQYPNVEGSTYPSICQGNLRCLIIK